MVEELLKGGELPCLVATSSLELGIDMGAVDLVIQVESPKSVARGLQRIGRAGHSVGDVSRGRIFPKFRGDLLECAVVARADARGGDRDHGRAPQPARRARPADRRRSPPPRPRTSRSTSMICSRWSRAPTPTPSCPGPSSRTSWTCSTAAIRRRSSPSCGRGSSGTASPGTIRARPGARQLAVTNAGTIPDRGLYAVTLPDGRRVGELDEEMVYEARPGPDVPARREHLADRGDRPRPGDRHPGARAARRGPVLEGRQRSAVRASSARRSARSRAGPSTSRPRRSSATMTSTAARPRTWSSSCPSSSRPRA